FDLAESDVSVDVVAICPVPTLLDFALQAPDGTIIGPAVSPNVAFQIDSGDEFYRVHLPAIPGNAAGTHGGHWTAVLGIRKNAFPVGSRRSDLAGFTSVAQRGALPYQLFVQSYSNLTMTVDLRQDSYLPGAKLTLVATLEEYRVPVVRPAR